MVVLTLLGEDMDLSDDQAGRWLEALKQRVWLAPTVAAEVTPRPFAATLFLERWIDESDAVENLADAFLAIAVRSGRLQLTLHEPASNDPEDETPPYADVQVDLAALGHVTVQLEWTTARDDPNAPDGIRGVVVTDAQLQILKDTVRAGLDGVDFMDRLNMGLSRSCVVRALLVPRPPDQVPTAEALTRLALDAAASAGLQPLVVEVGAFVRTWDNTVFQHQTKPGPVSG
jgi:hypothetical protein